jgi:hypothetical protein
MLDGMVAVETPAAKPVPGSPDKPALDYLHASGAAPIFVTEVDGVAAFRVGTKINPNARAIFWTMADAKPVVACARSRRQEPKH